MLFKAMVRYTSWTVVIVRECNIALNQAKF